MTPKKTSLYTTVDVHTGSISAATCLDRIKTQEEGLGDEVAELIELVSEELKSRSLRARIIRIIVESPSGRDVIRRASLESETSSATNLRVALERLVGTLSPSLAVKSIKVVVTGLRRGTSPEQMELFRSGDGQRRRQRGRLDRALDAVEAKIGGHLVGRGDDFAA